MLTNRKIRFALSGLLVLAGLAVLGTFAQAGVVTPGTPTKLGVYRRLLQIVNGPAHLEFGNNGQNIAASGDIRLLPDGLLASQAANGVTIKRVGPSDNARENLYLSGDLCLSVVHTGDPNAAFDCRHAWPTGGVAKWSLLEELNPFGQLINYLQPLALATGGTTPAIHLGLAVTPNPVPTNPYVALQGVAGSVIAANPAGTGYAATFTAGRSDLPALIANDATIGGLLKINGAEVWSHGAYDLGHQGQGSGLDADLLNGNDVQVKDASFCDDSQPLTPRIACLCFTVQFATDAFALPLNPITPKLKCIDLANRF